MSRIVDIESLTRVLDDELVITVKTGAKITGKAIDRIRTMLNFLPAYTGKIEEALKKQIPQRPITESEDYWLCPECGATNDYDEHDATSYCRCCGQAVYWDDDDRCVK